MSIEDKKRLAKFRCTIDGHSLRFLGSDTGLMVELYYCARKYCKAIGYKHTKLIMCNDSTNRTERGQRLFEKLIIRYRKFVEMGAWD